MKTKVGRGWYQLPALAFLFRRLIVLFYLKGQHVKVDKNRFQHLMITKIISFVRSSSAHRKFRVPVR
jgi:hypothetical protein